MKLKIIFKNIYLTLRRLILCLISVRTKSEDSKSTEIKSILVIRIDRIGDLIISLPALKLLKEVLPLAKICVLVRRGNDALLKSIPGIDEVIAYEGFIKTLRQLRQRQFDLAIDFLMDYPLRPALLARFSNAKLAAGFDIEDKGCLFHLKFKPHPKKKHVSEYILDLVRQIVRSISLVHIPEKIFYPEISISPRNRDYIKSFLKEKGAEEQDSLVGIHPGGHYSSQRWAIERFAQLADRIISRYKAKVVIVGSSQEESLVDQMISLMSQETAIKAVGLSLDKLASLLSLTALFIGNNSGPLNIAWAIKIPTVSTMGPADPTLWRPQGKGHIVIRHSLTCSPCNLAVCKRHECMELITVEEMEKAVDIQMERIHQRKNLPKEESAKGQTEHKRKNLPEKESARGQTEHKRKNPPEKESAKGQTEHIIL